MTEVIFDCDQKKKKKKKKSLLDELDALDVQPTSISAHRPKHKKEAEDSANEDNVDGDSWLETITSFKPGPLTTRGRSSYRRNSGIFDDYDGKKKKKKKKGKEEAVDYGKELEPEMHLLRNLLNEQSRFTDSLQKRYDVMSNSKTAARGVGKFTTDLIGQITQARAASEKLVMDIINAKKTVAELNMKERKEKGALVGDGEDLSAFSSRFLQQVLKENRKDLSTYGNDAPMEGTDDDIYDNIALELGDEEQRSDEVDLFLKYEKRNPKVVAMVNSETEEYQLVAIAGDNGEILEDYPVPETDGLSINRSTNIATDDYHAKYEIKWV